MKRISRGQFFLSSEFSLKTEKNYLHWIRRYIVFSDMRHPEECGDLEVIACLSNVAVSKKASVNTQ